MLMPSELLNKSCAPCHGGTAPLRGAGLAGWLTEVPGWDVVDEHHLHREYRFPDFVAALKFVNQVGAIAEQEQHHPDIGLGWGKVEITSYTHSIQGLSENDFILAAKIEAAFHTTATPPTSSQ